MVGLEPSDTGLILGLRPANERRRYKVTPSLIGWAQSWIQPYDRKFALLVLVLYIYDTRTLHHSITVTS